MNDHKTAINNDGDNAPDELIYGRNPVLEALKAGRAINKVLIAEGETHGALRPIEAMCSTGRSGISPANAARIIRAWRLISRQRRMRSRKTF